MFSRKFVDRLLGVLTATSLVLAAFFTPASVAASPVAQKPVQIEPLVQQQLAAQGQTTFWVFLREKADLSPAFKIPDWNARGRFVFNTLRATAGQSQSGLRSLLMKRGATFRAFWVANAIKVTGNQALLNEISKLPEVEQILADRVFYIPDPITGQTEPTVNTVEWNIDRINAPQVWSTFGVRGEGIVVSSIDTGVEYTHSALVAKYRGNLGGGNFDHNYNWFDPSNVCGNPSLAPCDNVDHGTHTMGTMVGDDGDPGTNQIGVAPHARWIAAKGCETNSCSSTALLASAQWILAPTDLSGQNPRPDLRPNIVNNSWGGGGGDPWYQSMVQAWVASGIFPAFSNGNAGPGCSTSGSPGDYPESYAAGAFDINNAIASFSSRGPSAFGGIIKPNIAAPGVSVRSSVPGGGYASFSGTSMASPHVAGTVALLWSAAPALIGDIAGTEALLDQSAIDTSDLQCGGTAADNNVWGEGRLDAFALLSSAPVGPTGTLTGTVTDAGTNLPIAGVTIDAVGPSNRSTTTDANGQYTLLLAVGTYDVTASAFGYITQTASGVVITDGATTTQDFALVGAPSHVVSGTVRDNFLQPVANATVTILSTPIPPAVTDANGFYSFGSVPEGTYDMQAAAGRCNDPQTQTLVVSGDETLDFALPLRTDSFGYFCSVVTPAFIDANTVLPLTGDDASVQVSLPFPFTFYGQTYNSTFVATNGYLNFLAANSIFSNSGIPGTAAPNGAIYPFWDDLYVDGSSSVRSDLLGSAPNREFVIEWLNVRPFGDTTRRMDFEVVLHENGQILTQYRNIAADGREQGNSATLGIENAAGTVAFQYSFNEAVIASPEFAVLYRLPPSGFVEGTVTDANDTLPISGATIKALMNGSTIRQVTTDGNGFYHMQLPLGSYDIEASATNYTTASAPVVLDQEDETVTQDFVLTTPRGVVTPNSLEFIVPAGQTRTKTLTLSNTGSADMTWEARETGGGQVTTTSTFGLEKNPGYDPSGLTTQGLYMVDTPSGWSPTAPGDVLTSWPSGLELAWGVGYTGNVWLSDIPNANNNVEFSTAGATTGRLWHAGWAGSWPGDMAFDAGRNLVCQVNVGGDNGIYCWDPATGNVAGSIAGAFPWTGISQRGLAYRADDDSFYIGGWNEGVLYHVKGLSYPDKGAVISQCNPPDGNISGLAWNGASNIVWEATNSPTDTIYELDPSNCTVLNTLPHPHPGFNGGGLEMDEAGNLWMISQAQNSAYLVESGVPAFTDVPWLSEDPSSGTLTPGASQQIAVTVDTTGLQPGVYSASIFIRTNSGREPVLAVPVSLIVPAYYQAVNAGNGAYTDSQGDYWSADKMYSAGSWGYTNKSSRTAKTSHPISGTVDGKLFQSLRQSPTEYRFDGLPNGVYQVTLDFAEFQKRNPGTRLFDVIIEGTTVLPAHDIAGEVGQYAADIHTFFVQVTDGQLNIRFVERRGYAPPIINAIQVIHRPDR